MKNDTGIWGQATIRLLGPEGDLKFYEVKKNLITTVGDQYYAKMGCVGIDGNTAPILAARMQLGTGTTDPTKSGAGAALGALVSGSSATFTDVSPAVVSGDTGWKITYSASWAAGVATDTAITEAVITTATDGTISLEAETIARVEFTAINKGASDTLVINWVHTFYDNPTP